MSQPNPSAEVVRAARAYLAALLAPGDVADAWHDVLGDVRYWGETDITSVMKITHGVVEQRQRTTTEAQYLALTQDAGVDDLVALAEILAVDADQLANMEAATVAAITEPVVMPESAIAPESPRTVQTAPVSSAPTETVPTAAAPPSQPPTSPPPTQPTPPAATSATMVPPAEAQPQASNPQASQRPSNGPIRFHAEAGSIDPIGELQRKVDVPLDQATKVSGRSLLMWAAVIWAIVMVLWMLQR